MPCQQYVNSVLLDRHVVVQLIEPLVDEAELCLEPLHVSWGVLAHVLQALQQRRDDSVTVRFPFEEHALVTPIVLIPVLANEGDGVAAR